MLILFIVIQIEQRRTAVLILARGGSKGIWLKNLRKLEGTSLLTRAIHTVKLAGLDDITVSTDHHLIALESLLSGGVKIFHRSQVTATDWAPSIWGASEFISHRPDVDILVLLQVTSPFLHSKSLRAGVEVINNPTPRDCVFSAKRSHNLRWIKLGDNIWPKNFKLNNRPRRQDWDGEFIETGAFYISRRHLIENGYFQNNKAQCLTQRTTSLCIREVVNALNHNCTGSRWIVFPQTPLERSQIKENWLSNLEIL